MQLRFLTVDFGPDGLQCRSEQVSSKAFSFSGQFSEVYLWRSSSSDKLTCFEGFAMTLYDQIQKLIMKCIVREISVKAFREQFVPLFFSINRRYDIDAVALADSVDNLYSDLLIGDFTEDEFRQKLIQLTPIITTVEEAIVVEWAFKTTTGTPPAEEVGPKNRIPQTSSDAQLLCFATSV